MPARSPTWHCSPTPSPCRTTNPASSDRTWNAVSAEGVKLISTTLDTVGWYARSVADLALLADTFALQDDEPSVFQTVAGARILIDATAYKADAASLEAWAQAAQRLEAAGA